MLVYRRCIIPLLPGEMDYVSGVAWFPLCFKRFFIFLGWGGDRRNMYLFI
jgi:hypothetical protein